MASRPPEPGPTGRMEPTPPTSTERQRWLVLNVMRLVGVAMVVLGLAMTQGGIDIAGGQNRLVGFIFVVVGLADMFIMPLVLARKWRTPRP